MKKWLMLVVLAMGGCTSIEGLEYRDTITQSYTNYTGETLEIKVDNAMGNVFSGIVPPAKTVTWRITRDGIPLRTNVRIYFFHPAEDKK